MTRKKTTEEYVADCVAVGLDKFTDHSAVIYNGKDVSIILRCRKCDHVFNMNAGNHLYQKQGCRRCSYARRGIAKRLTVSRFLNRAAERYGIDRYSYPKLVQYDDFSQFSRVTIHCLKCDHVFEKQVKAHLYGEGCHNCAVRVMLEDRKLTPLEVRERLFAVHGNKYDVELDAMDGVRSKVTATCRAKGHQWIVTLGNLLYAKHGCPWCHGRISKPETTWLDDMSVPQDQRQKRVPGTRWTVDALVGNTIFEFYGAYYHGDPRHGHPNKINTRADRTYLQLYDATLARQEKLERLGYEVKFVWELDWLAGAAFSQTHPARWPAC